MPDYRIYNLTRDDKISGVSTVVTCDNDGEAIQKARHMNGFDIEVWDGSRAVFKLKFDRRSMWGRRS